MTTTINGDTTKKESVNRRNFVKGALVTAGLTTTGLLNSANASNTSVASDNKKINWVCLVSWPKDLDLLYSGATKIVENVKKMTNGNFTITLLEDGSINKDMELLDVVSNGLVQCGHTASDYFSGRNSAMNFFTSMPFGLHANEHLAWLNYGGGEALSDKIYGKMNIKSFPAGNTSSQMGGWFNKKISSKEDLEGLKVRITGMSAQVFKEMGATPTSVPYLQLDDAIKSGKLDAAEFVGPYDDMKLGLHKVAKYYYAPGWWQIGDQLEMFVNKDAFAKLPTEYQEIFKIACLEANAELTSEYNYKNSVALQEIQKNPNVSLQQFPLEFIKESYELVQNIHQKNSKENPDYKEVYASWQPFVERSTFWRNYIGKSMMNF